MMNWTVLVISSIQVKFNCQIQPGVSLKFIQYQLISSLFNTIDANMNFIGKLSFIV